MNRTLRRAREKTYQTLPLLRQPRNNLLMLFTWSATVTGHQADILGQWACTDDGEAWYMRVRSGLLIAQNPEQFILALGAITAYHRLRPQFGLHPEQTIRNSSLADFGALLLGAHCRDAGFVLEHMLTSMFGVLGGIDNGTLLTELLLLTIHPSRPLTRDSNSACDKYLASRLTIKSHQSAMQESLMRVSDIEDQGVKALFCSILRSPGVVHSLELSDASWEVKIQAPYCRQIQARLTHLFPNITIDLDYDPMRPSAKDVARWGSEAQALCNYLFSQRTTSLQLSDCIERNCASQPRIDREGRCGICGRYYKMP